MISNPETPSLLVLSALDIDKITTTLSPDDLITLTKSVFTCLSSRNNDISVPHRTSIQSTNHTTLFMPSRIDAIGTAIKVVSVPNSSSSAPHGLPASTIVLDESTGAVKALVNARGLTALRTAAGSLLATCLVGPKNPLKLVAFGAGKQIEMHIDLFLRAYPSIRACVIINRTANERLSSLINRLRKKHYAHRSDKRCKDEQLSREVEFGGVDGSILDRDSRSALLSDADIICTATSSRSPLFTSDDIPNTHTRHIHINLVGSYTPSMHEVDSALIRRAALVVVDSRVACLGSVEEEGEAGELLKAGMNGEDVIELGELVLRDKSEVEGEGDCANNEYEVEAARHTGVLPTSNRTLTIFKSVGVGVQDVAIAELVVRRAEEMGGVGVRVEEYDKHDVGDI